VFGVLGPLSGAIGPADANVVWAPSEADEYFATSVAMGDVDGDKSTDVLIGDMWEGGTPPTLYGYGAAYLQLGLTSGTIDPRTLVSLTGDDETKEAGAWVGFLPDWDGDDADELVVGAPYADRGGKNGAFFLFPSELFY
jgi:hypothetical protein